MSRFSRLLTLSLVLGVLPACGGDDPVPLPLTIAIEAGNAQTGVAGQPVGTPPSVKATRGTTPIAGTQVVFTVASGGGTLVGATATTDAQGIARVTQWTLGTTLGAQSVTATSTGATGSPLTFTATAAAGAAAAATKEVGDAQTGGVGGAVPIAPAVRVVDAGGNRVAGVTVVFTVGVGGGTAANATAVTNSNGIATVGSWTLGTTAGANTLLANVQAGSVTGNPVTFTATATAGTASTLTKQAGDAQSAGVTTAVAVRPAVKVADQFGNAIAGATVTFAVATGGGTITGGTATTGADGIATVGSWTLGNTSGAQTLTATVPGVVTPATFSVTATASAAKTVVKTAGDAQSVLVGGAAPIKPAVKVTDQFGNPVSGVSVTFAVTTGNGSVTGGTVNTGADGVATVGSFIVGQTVGANVLRATVTGAGITNNPIDFTATSLVGAPAVLLKVAGDLQNVLQGSAVPIKPSVKLTDLYGNPLAGLQVTFGPANGGGVLFGTTQTTNASGIATVGNWIVGDIPGTNTVAATAGNISVTFSATSIATLQAGQYAGAYTGTWTNVTFSTTNTASATIVNNAGPSTANVTIAALGTILGVAGGIPATERVTTYGDTTAAFNGNVPQLGNIVMAIKTTSTLGTLSLIASGTNAPNPGVVRWDATGTITPTAIDISFIVTFTSGPQAFGTINLTKP
ncbi:MAG: hypothetical protein ABJB74_09520 [Gemmatimonas sp.]